MDDEEFEQLFSVPARPPGGSVSPAPKDGLSPVTASQANRVSPAKPRSTSAHGAGTDPAGSAPATAFELPPGVQEKLLEYQREGVEWLLRRHRFGRGAILADEMGLGKTVQVASFLGGLYRAKSMKTCLIIVPPTLLPVWTSALGEWGALRPPLVEVLHDESREVRKRRWVRLAHGTPCVFLTTYGILKQDSALMTPRMVDYVILDEAQAIKDAGTLAYKSATALSSRHRIAITGTPVMNSFQDLWSLFHFTDGAILGASHAEFRRVNASLLRGNENDATADEQAEAARLLAKLRESTRPYVLRREKVDVGHLTSRKSDYVVWVRLTEAQRRQYLAMLTDGSHHEVGEGMASAATLPVEGDEPMLSPVALGPLDDGEAVPVDVDVEYRAGGEGDAAPPVERGPLMMLSSLVLLCNHPWLLLPGEAYRDALAAAFAPRQSVVPGCDPKGCSSTAKAAAPMGDVLGGAKVDTAVELVRSSVRDGHKVLLFSRSRRLLAIVAGLLEQRGMAVAHVNGDLTLDQRMAVVERFHRDDSLRVCLLTTQVGGVGLTFNAASVVVLLDPSWNPSADAQAVDRVHRIGQTRDVFVYRLVTSGTVEEKIYRNQVFKTMAARQSSRRDGDQVPFHRYFSKLQLRSMFSVGDFDCSETMGHLAALHPGSVCETVATRLSQLPHVCGLSNNGAIFSGTGAAAATAAAAAAPPLPCTSADAPVALDGNEQTSPATQEAPPRVGRTAPGGSDLPVAPTAAPRPLGANETCFVPVPVVFRRREPGAMKRPRAASAESDGPVHRDPPSSASRDSSMPPSQRLRTPSAAAYRDAVGEEAEQEEVSCMLRELEASLSQVSEWPAAREPDEHSEAREGSRSPVA